MKVKIAFILVAVVMVMVGYIAGFKLGPNRQRQQSEIKFRIEMGQRLYQFLSVGETNRAMSEIRFVLWSDTVGYERAFGVPTDTDSFAKWFAEAKATTAQVEPELRTNAQIFERDIKALFASNNITIEKR